MAWKPPRLNANPNTAISEPYILGGFAERHDPRITDDSLYWLHVGEPVASLDGVERDGVIVKPSDRSRVLGQSNR